MRKLITIKKREKLNEISAVDEKGNGGANHNYSIAICDDEICHDEAIRFQNGARRLESSIHGITDQDLLEIVRDRFIGFQSGELRTRETALALTHIEEALLWLNKRNEDRIERNVLGTDEK